MAFGRYIHAVFAVLAGAELELYESFQAPNQNVA
jgi:hypothetical protein